MTADHESAGIFAGKYFGSRTALELEFGSGTASQEQRVTPYFGIGPADGFPGFADDPFIELKTGTNTETEDARLSVRHVGQLGGSTFALSASLRTSRSETHVQLPAPPGIFTPIGPFDPPDGEIGAVHPDLISHEGAIGRSRPLGTGAAIVTTVLFGVGVTNQVEASMTVHDGGDGALLWSYDHEVGGG